MPRTRSLPVLKEVARCGIEEAHRRSFLEGGGVRYVYDHRGTFQHFGESLAGESIDTCIG